MNNQESGTTAVLPKSDLSADAPFAGMEINPSAGVEDAPEEKTSDQAESSEVSEGIEPKPKGEQEAEPKAEKPEGEETSSEEPKTEPKAEPLLAGRFKTTQDLEVAYNESSKEGRRLNAELTKAESIVGELESKLAAMELENEVGSFRELTKEQLIELMNSEDPEDRLAAQEYLVNRRLHEQNKSRLEKETKQRTANQERMASMKKKQIDAKFDEMKNDAVSYPEFTSLMPLMNEMADAVEDRLAGMPNGIEALYYMALGFRQLQAKQNGALKSKEELEKTKREAQMKARVAGSSGPTSTLKVPSGKNQDNDDDAFNDRLLKASQSKEFHF